MVIPLALQKPGLRRQGRLGQIAVEDADAPLKFSHFQLGDRSHRDTWGRDVARRRKRVGGCLQPISIQRQLSPQMFPGRALKVLRLYIQTSGAEDLPDILGCRVIARRADRSGANFHAETVKVLGQFSFQVC